MAPACGIFASERVYSWSEPVFFGVVIFRRVLGMPKINRLPENRGYGRKPLGSETSPSDTSNVGSDIIKVSQILGL